MIAPAVIDSLARMTTNVGVQWELPGGCGAQRPRLGACASLGDPASPRQAGRRHDGSALSHRVPRGGAASASVGSKSSLKGQSRSSANSLGSSRQVRVEKVTRARTWSLCAIAPRNSHCTPTDSVRLRPGGGAPPKPFAPRPDLQPRRVGRARAISRAAPSGAERDAPILRPLLPSELPRRVVAHEAVRAAEYDRELVLAVVSGLKSEHALIPRGRAVSQ